MTTIFVVCNYVVFFDSKIKKKKSFLISDVCIFLQENIVHKYLSFFDVNQA